MSASLTVALLAIFLTALFSWAFRSLPREQWQIFAALPREREPGGGWRGINLTYYGVLNALAVGIGVMVAIFLAGTVGLPLALPAWGLLAILAVSVPASRIVNRLVEGHWHGFTVGGASFIGMVLGPWLVWSIWRFGRPTDGATEVLYVMGTVSSAYALGEGIGRLACISFGCCYGRALEGCPSWIRTLFSRWAFVFEGQMKKASYERGLEGQRLIPVQALTAIISSAAGLAGIALFLGGRPGLAYVVPIVITQLWRFLSEFLRADFRGHERISAYQRMALVGAAYTVVLGLLWPAVPHGAPDVARGFSLLWTPGAILFIEAIAAFVFVRMGVSTITTSHVSFDLTPDRPRAPPPANG